MSDLLAGTGAVPPDGVVLSAVRDGRTTMRDVSISAESLVHQAEVAEAFGNPQLAESFRRGAEMTALEDAELLRFYDALRPGRSSVDDLLALAEELEQRDMPRCSRLVREAAEVYPGSGLTR